MCALQQAHGSGRAFVGKSVCILCAASGMESLTFVDVGSALESGMMYGKGAACLSLHSIGYPTETCAKAMCNYFWESALDVRPAGVAGGKMHGLEDVQAWVQVSRCNLM